MLTYISKHSAALYFHISIWIFCILFICLVFDGLLLSIYSRMSCSKHSIAFENTHLLICWFYCTDIVYKKFVFCETFTVTTLQTLQSVVSTSFQRGIYVMCFWGNEVYLLRHCLTWDLLSVDLPHNYTCMF